MSREVAYKTAQIGTTNRLCVCSLQLPNTEINYKATDSEIYASKDSPLLMPDRSQTSQNFTTLTAMQRKNKRIRILYYGRMKKNEKKLPTFVNLSTFFLL